MSHDAIRGLFNDAISKDPFFIMPFGRDGKRLEADTKVLHIESHLIPADTDYLTLSYDITEFTGVFQVKVIGEKGKGTREVQKVVTELQRLFDPRNTKLFIHPVTGFTVQVISPVHTHEGRNADGKWVVPCSFQYWAGSN